MSQSQPSGLRLAVVLSHPTQYYSPWFRWLAVHTPLQVRVFYLWNFGVETTRDPHFGTSFKWDVDLLSAYEHEFVPNIARHPGTYRFFGLRNPQLTARLADWHPDAALIFGYAYESNLRALAWCRLHRVPVLFRGDSHFLGRACPHPLTRALLWTLYRGFDAVTYVGQANRSYFSTLGVPPGKLFFVPHAVDPTRFDSSDARIKDEALALRQRLGILPTTRVFLFAGKLVPAKQPVPLLDAFLKSRRPDTCLVMVGDGEERGVLERRVAQAPPGSVHLLPFANQSEMPARYALGDIFVLPSRGLYETWGLAVNEAMHMQRPALVSDRVGCGLDLISDGKTGWVFASDDPDGLSGALDRAARADLAAMRPAIAERIARFSYSAAADGVMQAIAYARRKSS